MKSSVATGLIAVGVLILLIGFIMPATTTQTSTTCIDDPLGVGQDCIQSTYEVPNTGKYGIISLGVVVFVTGIVSRSSDSFIANTSSSDQLLSSNQSLADKNESQEPESKSRSTPGGSKSLKEQLQEYDKNDKDRDSSKK